MTDREMVAYIKEAINTYFLFNTVTPSDRINIEGMVNNLEKQIAKKVVDGHSCPTCGCYIEFDYDYDYNYCPECGQKLEW